MIGPFRFNEERQHSLTKSEARNSKLEQIRMTKVRRRMTRNS